MSKERKGLGGFIKKDLKFEIHHEETFNLGLHRQGSYPVQKGLHNTS